MRNHPQFKAYLALISVCLFWGGTYLGIRMALESFPPTLLIAVRFTLSGAILLLVAKARGYKMPHGAELLRTARNGILTLGIGTGGLVFAEVYIPSGLAALIITTGPFSMVAFEALVPGGVRLRGLTLVGMVVGCAGAALLVLPDALKAGGGNATLIGFLILQLSAIAWALGSILQRREPSKVHPVVGGAVHQLAAGLAFVIPALLIPEHPVDWSIRGTLAIVYLIVFGSIIGYSSYVYALAKLPVAIVSIYTYVNPVVAVVLGWLFYREPFGIREAVAMVIIFIGVALVKRFS